MEIITPAPVVTDMLTVPVTFTWRNREWESVTDAMAIEEMQMYLTAHYRGIERMDAYKLILRGGLFDVVGKYSFNTYYVHRQSVGMLRLFHAIDARDLCNGQTW